jgi:ABC-type methionine transport system ATPase subunit
LCCIGRALIADPMIVLADEPLAALDGDQADVALSLLKAAHARGASVLLFTQSTSLAHRLNARVMQLEHGKLEGTAKAAAKHRAPSHHAPVKAEEPEDAKELESEAPHEEKHAHVSHAAHPKKTTHTPRSKGKVKITSIGS